MVLSWKENLPTELKEKVDKVDKIIEPRLEEIDEQVFYNQQRVLDLFRKHRVGEEDLVPSTGYGYDEVEGKNFHKRFEDMIGRPNLLNLQIGATIGVHTGPYPLGIGFIKKYEYL